LSLTPADPAARGNRQMTLTYLKRLQELLKQEEEDATQSMGQAQPGEGPPQEGEDGEGEPQEGEGGKGKGESGEGQGDPENDEGQGDKGDQKDKGKNGEDESEEKGDKGGDNPNESPEERAHRILEENADTEKGPLTPGRREFRDAEKDW
jgi:Ca-activated chloride channel family protein